MKNKNLYKAVIIVAVIIILAVIAMLIIPAEAQNLSMGNRVYKQIMVEEGDTLWSIAVEYKPQDCSIEEYIAELKKLNAINGDTILAGYNLTVYEMEATYE